MALDPGLTGDYTLDSASTTLGFVARHALITKVRGHFTEVAGSGRLDAADPTGSSLTVTLGVASITTGVTQRDGPLRTNDFLDVATYPEITFVSTGVEVIDDGHYSVTGDLTIKATTKPVTFDLALSGPVEDPDSDVRIGLKGSLDVNRRDWGVQGNAALDAGGVLVGAKVTLTFDAVAVRNQ